MGIGLYLLLETFTLLFDGSSATAEWHQIAGLLRGTALVITAHRSGWVVCLLVVGMPLAAAVAHRRWRRADDARDAAESRRSRQTTAVLCLAGCLTAVALTLGVSAVTHAHIAEAVRWSPDFLGRLVFFDEHAIVVVAVTLLALTQAQVGNETLHWVVVTIPILAAVLAAVVGRRAVVQQWVMLRAAAEAIKAEIYRYRTLAPAAPAPPPTRGMPRTSRNSRPVLITSNSLSPNRLSDFPDVSWARGSYGDRPMRCRWPRDKRVSTRSGARRWW
jgi:hypothetical protein